METAQTKKREEEAGESAEALGGRLRALAGGAADTAARWAKRCGETLSRGRSRAALQAEQIKLRRQLERAYAELGRAVYALHEDAEDEARFAGLPEVEAKLKEMEKLEQGVRSSRAKIESLRQRGDEGDPSVS